MSRSTVFDRPPAMAYIARTYGNLCDVCGKRRGTGVNQKPINHEACSRVRKQRGFSVGRDARNEKA